MITKPTPREIDKWYPTKWSHIVGNDDVKEYFRNMIQTGPANGLITGPNGTGKSRATVLWLRSMLCGNRSEDLDPCGQCNACRFSGSQLTSVDGLFVGLSGAACCVHIIDCQTVSSMELKELCRDSSMEDPRTIIFLDEIAALVKRNLCNEIKNICENSKASWVGASVMLKPKKVRKRRQPEIQFPPEMNRRFALRIGTQLPQSQDLEAWIRMRCEEWSIHLEGDQVVKDMVKRTNRVRHILEMMVAGVIKPSRTLTCDDVRKFNLVSPD